MTTDKETEPAPSKASSALTCSTGGVRVLDLFSGIGGFSLGLERTGGFRTIAFCEIEKFPRSILRKHWPDVPIFEDVRGLHAEDLPEPVDLICGGYPCQPFSVAGKRRGKEDDRHLWPEIVRLIRELAADGNKPTWSLFENVGGHISMGLDQVLTDLESEGYSAWPLVIPACAVNAPHRRDRVWILAHADDTGIKKRNSAAEPEKPGQYCRAHFAKYASNSSCKLFDRAGDIWPAGRDEFADSNEWTTESPVCGPDDGIPNRVARLKALGNAVVPQIPEMIGHAIMAAEAMSQ